MKVGDSVDEWIGESHVTCTRVDPIGFSIVVERPDAAKFTPKGNHYRDPSYTTALDNYSSASTLFEAGRAFERAIIRTRAQEGSET